MNVPGISGDFSDIAGVFLGTNVDIPKIPLDLCGVPEHFSTSTGNSYGIPEDSPDMKSTFFFSG